MEEWRRSSKWRSGVLPTMDSDSEEERDPVEVIPLKLDFVMKINQEIKSCCCWETINSLSNKYKT